MLGMLAKNQTIKANIPREERSTFGQAKWGFLLGADFDISNRCCTVMKKNPAHDFHKKTGKNPMIATMASESKLRTQKWLQNGCNGFDLAIPTSTPMSFWTEQDVLLYIKTHNLPICSVYGDVVEEIDENHVEGQMTISDLDGFEKMWLFDAERPTLKTTGCQRTGCALCGFGAHCRKDERFLELKSSHPKMYDLLDVVQNNGVTMREAIEWVNEHGNVNIKL